MTSSRGGNHRLIGLSPGSIQARRSSTALSLPLSLLSTPLEPRLRVQNGVDFVIQAKFLSPPPCLQFLHDGQFLQIFAGTCAMPLGSLIEFKAEIYRETVVNEK